MKIKVKFVGYLNIKGVKDNSWINIEDSKSISQLLINHGISLENQKYITATVNKKSQSLSYVFCDNDELFLHLPVGGG
ncbi:MAG: hypothetical protein PF551_08065 [Candidatus Marinimicrobia bacterium]|jgi:hypothetical protein|nr:hypothetical protein [Candidatus Neomarinimicrobiota bacterium]